MPRFSFFLVAAVASVSAQVIFAAPITTAQPDAYKKTIQPFLEQHCYDCHDDSTQKGGVRLDNLPADFANADHAQGWVEVFDQLSSGQMPPKKKTRPPQGESAAVLGWVKTGLTTAESARRNAEGRVVLRRLNRTEYQNTIRDLLGVDSEVRDLLPEDSTSMGFDNIGEALNVSSVLMERYLETADVALDAAIVKGPRPETKKWNVSMYPETKIPEKDFRLKTGVLGLPDETFVYFNSGDVPIVCDRFKAPIAGRYRVKITGYAYQSAAPVTMGVLAGSFDVRSMKTHAVGFYDLRPDQARVIEFTDIFPLKGTLKIMAYGLGKRTLDKDVDKYTGPGVAVSRVEVEGPVFDQWPPASHTRLFGNLDLKDGTLADAEKTLRWLAPRAFRRPVTNNEVAPYVALVKAQLDDKQPFEQAVRVGLKALLCSPDFLFLKEPAGRLNDFQIASRLSYFLGSTMPDDALIALAARHTLARPEVLRAQTERMLNDARAAAFTENFTGQWLGLRLIDFTTPDKKLYPEFDDRLQFSMLEETHRFFGELLSKDLSLLNFVQSDFSFLNARLAEHYGIAGVAGQEFRKVALPPESHRGGVLTQASVLKVTANGTVTSPVGRGAWVLRNIIGKPPKLPPPGTPAIEPDIRGAKTIREQLDKHKDVESCASCHLKMDPPGNALESFDVIGGWRENYRSVGEGKSVKTEVQGRRVGYKIGPAVDPADTLPDGRKFTSSDELKQLLLADKDLIARALAERLLVYATGAGIEFSDRAALDQIVAHLRAKHYGFRTLIHEVVQSPTFLAK